MTHCCDMSNAPDTPEERFAEWRDLLGTSLVSTETIDGGVRFRLRAPLEEVEALAAKERECCPWFESTVTSEVVWELRVLT